MRADGGVDAVPEGVTDASALAATATATDGGAAARRDWATLPPMVVAGRAPDQPHRVSAATFVEACHATGVGDDQPRLEHVRHLDAPSGSLRGVLATAEAGRDR